MNILHISDTHGFHRQLTGLPAADVIVHSGDFTFAGSEAEAFDFIEWFCDLPYAHKVFIAGNHDACLYSSGIEGLDDNCHYLDGGSVVIEGVKFHGIPLFVEDQIGDRFERMVAEIPRDTDVLITHCPPRGILDFADGVNYGSSSLLQQVQSIRPKAHLFGHIHVRRGEIFRDGTHFSNAATVSGDYNLYPDFRGNLIAI